MNKIRQEPVRLGWLWAALIVAVICTGIFFTAGGCVSIADKLEAPAKDIQAGAADVLAVDTASGSVGTPGAGDVPEAADGEDDGSSAPEEAEEDEMPIVTCGSCDDGNDCTQDVCEGGACAYYQLTGAACEDDNLCTKGDTCVGGECWGGQEGCNDGNACTTDACNGPSAGCVHVQVNCSSLCLKDECDPQIGCTADPEVNCSESPCYVGTCIVYTQDEIVCKLYPICDDEDPCTQDSCVDGKCSYEVATNCDQ